MTSIIVLGSYCTRLSLLQVCAAASCMWNHAAILIPWKTLVDIEPGHGNQKTTEGSQECRVLSQNLDLNWQMHSSRAFICRRTKRFGRLGWELVERKETGFEKRRSIAVKISRATSMPPRSRHLLNQPSRFCDNMRQWQHSPLASLIAWCADRCSFHSTSLVAYVDCLIEAQNLIIRLLYWPKTWYNIVIVPSSSFTFLLLLRKISERRTIVTADNLSWQKLILKLIALSDQYHIYVLQ